MPNNNFNYYDFTKGKYRAYIDSKYKNWHFADEDINSNVYKFECIYGEEDGSRVLTSDIAISHTQYNTTENDKLWMVYVAEPGNKIVVKSTTDVAFNHWKRWNIPEIEADKVTIGFNSDIAGISGHYEFITDEKPYIVYIKDNAVYILNMNNMPYTPELMIAENVIDISLVRAPKFIQNQSVDFGFTLFFLMENQLYYRQMIAGIWYDAEVVNLDFASGTILTNIEAFVTWDFRVGVLITTSTGQIVQLISYFEGLSNLMNEHIEMNLSANVLLEAITYYNTYETEHIEMNLGANVTMLYAHSAIVTNIINIDNGEGDYGVKIRLTFNHPNTAQNLLSSMFTLVDSNNINYLCNGWSLSQDGYNLTLDFDNFNLAIRADNLTLTYTKPSSGGLLSPAVQTETFSQTFVPVNLIDPGNPPEFLTAWNDEAGELIYVRMNKKLVNRTFDELNGNFDLSLKEYNYVPHGQLVDTTRTVEVVRPYEGTVLKNRNASLNDTVLKDDGSITLGVELGNG